MSKAQSIINFVKAIDNFEQQKINEYDVLETVFNQCKECFGDLQFIIEIRGSTPSWNDGDTCELSLSKRISLSSPIKEEFVSFLYKNNMTILEAIENMNFNEVMRELHNSMMGEEYFDKFEEKLENEPGLREELEDWVDNYSCKIEPKINYSNLIIFKSGFIDVCAKALDPNFVILITNSDIKYACLESEY